MEFVILGRILVQLRLGSANGKKFILLTLREWVKDTSWLLVLENLYILKMRK